MQRSVVKAGADPATTYNLRQVPKANGALIAMDPHTGRVLAMVGGYSFEQSQFNRATQAKRQPGSAFKPFVYAAALENGFTPADQILDAPFVIEKKDVECEETELGTLKLRGAQEERNEDDSADDLDENGEEEPEEDECERFYKPENYNEGNFYGLSTLRLGVEKSRNAMTVRLANEMGMTPVMRLSQRFGIYDAPKPELAWALGAGETTLLRLATAYSAMINGGKAVEPRILDRVQDGNGVTVFNAFDIECDNCQQESFTGGPPPELPDTRTQVIDPVTAYQVTYIMQGVVQNGTGARLRALARPLGGKTGTTNDSFDNWFMGFSPDLVVGVYVGMDTPEQMGRETGSSSAVPIVKDFLETVLKSQSKVPFRIPDGVTLAPVNRTTGEPTYIGAPEFILEAFKPGTEPSVGGLGTRTRFGSGTDSLGGFFGAPSISEDDKSIEDLLAEDVASSDEDADEVSAEEDSSEEAAVAPKDGSNSEATDGAEDVGDTAEGEAPEATDPADADLSNILDRAEAAIKEETPQGDAPKLPETSQDIAPETPQEVTLETPQDIVPEPEEPVEKALDDGIY